eukprot:31341-Prorocentrum_minimum.AAC.1
MAVVLCGRRAQARGGVRQVSGAKWQRPITTCDLDRRHAHGGAAAGGSHERGVQPVDPIVPGEYSQWIQSFQVSTAGGSNRS